MGDKGEFSVHVDNSELAGYFEAFLEDFRAISTDMLSAINTDRGATLKIPDAEYNRLKRLGEALDGLAKRKFNFENTPNFQPVVDALGRVQKSIDGFKFPDKIPLDMPPMERNIATPEIDMKPVSQSIEKLEKLFTNGIGVHITNFEDMPLVFDKVTGSTGSGTSSEVTVTASALPTGAATNAKLDDVITAIGAIPGGGGIQYTEGDIDATITGTVMMWEDTSDTLRAVSAAKPLPISVASLPLPSGAATSAKQDTEITHLATLAGAVSGTEFQVDVLTMPTVAVTGTFWQATQPVSIAAAVAVTDNSGSLTVDAPVGTPVFVRLSDGASAISTLPVSLASVPSHAVTNAGTFATQIDGSALTALQLIDDTVFADDAAVTLGTSKANIAAGVAVATDGTDPSAVSAEGDAASFRTDMNRILLVNETHPRFWHVSADYASAQTNTSVKAAPGASLSLYITDISISNGATAGNITLLDGSGGTVLYEIYPAINGGAVLSLRNPIKLTSNTALCITSTTVTTHSIFVSGYIAP